MSENNNIQNNEENLFPENNEEVTQENMQSESINEAFEETVADQEEIINQEVIDEAPQPSEYCVESKSVDEVIEPPVAKKTPHIVTDDVKKSHSGTSLGIKIFCGLLTLCIVAGVCLTGGYLLGKQNTTVVGNKKISTSIKSKPVKEDVKSSAEVFQDIDKSVVYITVYSESGSKTATSASGVIYSSDGYIVTCDHIYADFASPKFRVTFSDGSEYSAKYVAGDARSDLAVLKIDAKGLSVPEFGNSDENVVGETAYAVGYACGFSDGASLTSGIISANNRRISSATTQYSSKLTQIDTPINPGNSGGALVNAYSQVIGITTSKLSGSDYEGVGFAVPSVNVTEIVDSLIKNGYVKGRAKLGITYTAVDSISAEQTGMPTGLSIVEISTDSELYGKGIKTGSIITEVNGEKIISSTTILDIIDSSTSGDEITLKIYDTNTKETGEYTIKLIEDKGTSSYNTTEKSSEEFFNDGNIFDEDNDSSSEGTLPF